MKRIIDCPCCAYSNPVLRTECYVNYEYQTKYYCVYCKNCGKSTSYYDNEESAIEAWNNKSLVSFLNDIEDHMVENSFDMIIGIKKFDSETSGYKFPINDYMTTKKILKGIVNAITSVKNQTTDKPLANKEEIIEWIKED